jgi:hypothetical protein
MCFFFLFLTSVFAAPKTALPAQRLAVDDGGQLVLPEISLALVGNTRPVSALIDKKRAVSGSGSRDVIGDITARGMMKPMTMLVHLGDMVTSSSRSNWAGFAKQFAGLIDGDTAPPTAIRRMPILPVVGDRDCAKQPSCDDFAKVFPGFGQEIGFGRVATWEGFDLVVGDGERWRVVVVDTNKAGLGSRWREQLIWLRGAVTDPGKGLIVLMHEAPISRKKGPAAEGATELMDLIMGTAPLLSVRAVFSAGASNSQLLLPEGSLGPLHVVAGGGGTPGDDLRRGVLGRPDGMELDATFESGLDHMVGSYLGQPKPPADKVVDEALGTGSFEGYPRVVDGSTFPGHGWWLLDIQAGGLSVRWRVKQGSGVFAEEGRWVWAHDTGWQGQPSKAD